MIWHWDVIKEIQKRHLQRRFGRPRLKHVQFLCVDEISIGKGHRSGLLAYYDYPLSSGPLEGTNNKIETVKRQAYGFRDPEFLKLRILGIHETKYALVG